MIIIYKELIKKYVTKITKEDIKKYALTQNEVLTEEESNIILNHIKKYHLELLNKNTSSFNILKQNLRKELFTKIVNLYNEYNHYL